MQDKKAKINMTLSMVIFGTIGIFRRYIELPSAGIACIRGIFGALFLLIFCLASKRKLSKEGIRGNLVLLLLSGLFIGFNWILLFEAYLYTSVSVATLCYYMAPVFVIIASRLVLGEKLTAKKLICILAALAGMVLISGVLSPGGSEGSLRGILLGLGAAVLYASVIIMNKKLGDIPAYDKTIVQLGTAGLAVLPYVLLTGGFGLSGAAPVAFVMLAVVSLIHTGLAYLLYFGSIGSLQAQTVALMGYIDPAVAIILSALILHEKMGPAELAGMVLILGATIISELPGKKE